MPAPTRTNHALPAGIGWWSVLLAAALLALWAATGIPAAAAAAPTVSAVSPSTAPYTGGTAVTITGTGFVVGATVTFDGAAATSVNVTSSTQITAVTPAGVEGAAVIEVTNPDTQSGTLTGGFTYLGLPPNVTGVAPASGSSLGGTVVTITGTDFVSGATVTIGGLAATGVTFDASTQLRATTPAHGVGAVDIVVTNPDAQNDTAVGAYSYTAAPAPTVSAASPTTGTTGGGTTVTLTGTGFGAGATVQFGGAAATNVVVVSATQITAKTPTRAAGTVDILVTNPDTQTGTLTAGYIFVASPAPTVTAVAPAVGSKSGGTAVTITGTGLLEGATVKFGGTSATNVVVTSTTTITATTPAGSVGKAPVTVTNTDLQVGTLAGAFEYLAAPTLSAVEPAVGSTAGGTALKLTGSGFASGATVTVGGTAATNVVWVSATQITATAPAHTAGVVDIVVTNPDSQSGTLTGKLTYATPPTLTAALPATGSTDGGTVVTIVGTGFVSGVTVKFGETAASAVALVSATELTATTPAGSAGVVAVTVTNPDGLLANLPFAFLYVAPSAETHIVNGEIPTVSGFGFIVFSGGDNAQLIAAAAATGCDESKMRFWATSGGEFVPFIPASKVQAVNAAWNALFPTGIPENWPLIATCA